MRSDTVVNTVGGLGKIGFVFGFLAAFLDVFEVF